MYYELSPHHPHFSHFHFSYSCFILLISNWLVCVKNQELQYSAKVVKQRGVWNQTVVRQRHDQWIDWSHRTHLGMMVRGAPALKVWGWGLCCLFKEQPGVTVNAHCANNTCNQWVQRSVFHTVSHAVCAVYLKDSAHMFILIVCLL